MTKALRNFVTPLFFLKIYTTFVVSQLRCYIFDESVLAFILGLKPRKFQLPQEEQHTRRLVLDNTVMGHLLCHHYANTGVGYCLFVVNAS